MFSHLQGYAIFLPLQALLCKAVLQNHMILVLEVIGKRMHSLIQSQSSLPQILKQIWVTVQKATLTYINVFFINFFRASCNLATVLM